jgi:phage/plasmid-associated DNA primase
MGNPTTDTAPVGEVSPALIEATVAIERRDGTPDSTNSDAAIATGLVKRHDIELHEADQIVAEAHDLIAKRTRASTPESFERCEDVGNGKRFVRAHGHEVRYIASDRSWLAWNGSLWKPGALGAVERHATNTALGIYGESARAASAAGGDVADKLAKWAKASCSRSRIEGMLYTARSHIGVEATWEDFDRDPWALNVRNGIVDLSTGGLRPHDPAEMHSKIAGAALRDAAAPRWEAFLAEVIPDAEVRHYVHKLAGYSATGEVGEHVLPFLYGGGANGKSVFVSVLRAVLGDYATAAAPDLLVARRERGIPTDIIDLRGFRFVTTSEIDGGQRMATDIMKRITGEDTLKARRMRQDFESFRHAPLARRERPAAGGRTGRSSLASHPNAAVQRHDPSREARSAPDREAAERARRNPHVARRGCVAVSRGGVDATGRSRRRYQ